MLHTSGVNENLVAIKDPDGKQRLYFNKKTPIPFLKVASNGTKALYVLYYWLTTLTQIDEERD